LHKAVIEATWVYAIALHMKCCFLRKFITT
jgi:hypothetical protein